MNQETRNLQEEFHKGFRARPSQALRKMLYITPLRTTIYGISSNLMEVTVAEVLPERLLTKTHR